jgi:hypothetical protein
MGTYGRFSGAKNKDNTARVIMHDYQVPTYAASLAIAVKPNVAKTIVRLALTGAITLTVNVGTATTDPAIGDELVLLFTTDGTQRIVTLSTGFASSGTITIGASKSAAISFMFNGSEWQAMGREIKA